MTPKQRTEQKRERYRKLIRLRDRIDRLASRAARRIHSHEGLSDFWLGAATSNEVVAMWPAWKKGKL